MSWGVEWIYLSKEKKKHFYPSGAIPPKFCKKCRKSWDYVSYKDTDRKGDKWDFLFDFPSRGCDIQPCPECDENNI